MKEIDTLKHVQDSASLSMIMDDVHSGKSSTGEYYFIITLQKSLRAFLECFFTNGVAT